MSSVDFCVESCDWSVFEHCENGIEKMQANRPKYLWTLGMSEDEGVVNQEFDGLRTGLEFFILETNAF